MRINNKIPGAILNSAVGMLLQYVPELSPVSLMEALKSYGAAPGKRSTFPEKWLTRREAAEVLRCSLSTIDNYLRDGLLDKKRVGPQRVEINPESVRRLLPGTEGGEA